MGTALFELAASDIVFSVSEKDLKNLDADIAEPRVFGQPRAIKALELGTSIHARGYNIFVTGLPGTGRRTAVKKMLLDYTPQSPPMQDIVFVYNFRKPVSPSVLFLPRGRGKEFKKVMHDLVEAVKKLVELQLKSEAYRNQEAELVSGLERKENAALSAFEAELAEAGFQIVQVGEDEAQTTDIIPVFSGEETTFDALRDKIISGEMSEADWNLKRERYYGFMDRMRTMFESLHESRSVLEARLKVVREETVSPQIRSEIESIRKRFGEGKVDRYLDDVEADLLSHLYLFGRDAKEHRRGPNPRRLPPFIRYGVNVAVDNTETERVPIVEENLPSYTNLFGSVEAPDGDGETRSDFLKVRAGSLIQANGGFLILRAEDFVQEEDSWTYLKRALQTGKVEIQTPPGQPAPPGSLLKPEAVDIDVKVVMIGNEMTYDLLYQTDPDIQKLFKVSAEFDSSMPLVDNSLREYMAFARKVVVEEKLEPIGYDGLAAVIEHGIRMSEYRNRLDTRFSLVADIVREASHLARNGGEVIITRPLIERAVLDRAYLHDLPEEKLDDMIASGEILISVQGKDVGKVNGLAVHDRGYYSFGRPTVISARTAPGKLGVVNIEGISGLSGEIYDKGVLIVEGFLRSRYAHDFPLCISATICFEQSYTAVDGDSASSTEIYALLSAISGVPLRQDLAVTGSVSQTGMIQPVGGATEKVEGFFKVCKRIGLTGSQGVIIPRQNVMNLTLSREIQEAVASGSFHLYAISTIDDGIELLTGMGRDDFNAAVKCELERMARLVKEYT
jgi:predicted ATP-dependent protease